MITQTRIPEQPLIRREVLRSEIANPKDPYDVIYGEKLKLWDEGLKRVQDATLVHRVVELTDSQIVPVIPFGGIMDRYRHVAGSADRVPFFENEMLDVLLGDVGHMLCTVPVNPDKVRFGGFVIRYVPDGIEFWTVKTDEFSTFFRTVWDFGQTYGGIAAVSFCSIRGAQEKTPQHAYAGISCLSGEPFYRATKNIYKRTFLTSTAYLYDMWAVKASNGAKWRQCESEVATKLEGVLKPQHRIDKEQMITLLCPPERWGRN